MRETIQALDTFQTDAQERLLKAQHAQQQIRAIQVIERSLDGSVTVTVGANGALRALTISSSGSETLLPDDLAELIMRTVHAAQRKVADRLRASIEPLIGGDAATRVLKAWG